MKNVLVIGAGKRVTGQVLPALACLEDRFRIAAVVARSVKELAIGDRRITTLDTIAGVDLAAIDLIVVAMTIEHVPRMLGELAARAPSHAVLLLDTPVVMPSGLWASRYFPAFRRVLVSEDNVALPPFLLALQLIDAGAVGRLERIFFFHNGFKGHALASLKLLARSPISRITSRRFSGKLRQKEIAFENGVSAVMYEPRDYAVGKFLLQGDRGAIADYDYAVAPVRRIGYQLAGPIYRGLTLDGAPVLPTGLDAAYLAGVSSDVPDASPMNTMKLRGLIDVLAGALEDHSPYHYDPASAVADFMAIRLVDVVGYVPAPFRLGQLVPVAQRLLR